MSPKIIMYTTKFCPYCVMAKQLLERKGVGYEEIRVDTDIEARRTMEKLSQRRTVPQIFIDEQHVGGFDDMAALDRAGKLDKMLNK